MTGATSAAELRRLLRRGLGARLEPAGWSVSDERAGGPFTLVAFLCPIDEQFAATADVQVAPSVQDRPPVSVSDLRVGVSYEPLRRLWPLLGAFGAAVVHEIPRSGETLFEVATPTDASRVAERLQGLILDRGVPFARARANLDHLIGAVRSGDPAAMRAQEPALCVAALLAAAGRFEEARDALSHYRPCSDNSASSREEQRIARQLRRWVDSAGDASLLPSEPPPSHDLLRAMPSFAELRRQATLCDQAVAEVTRAGRGHDRDTLRATRSRGSSQRRSSRARC